METRDERLSWLNGKLAEADRLLADLPPNDVFTRMGLEHHRQELRRELRRLSSPNELDQLRLIVDSLPRCSGEWINGSGGHRRHSPCCEAIATWNVGMYSYAYCDAHNKPHDHNEEFPYADAVREVGW